MKTIDFSGYRWDVRPAGVGGPGPNTWDDGNAYVDDNGLLHLSLTSPTNVEGDTEWHCVELNMQQRLGFGRYQFLLNSRVDQLDRNVVLGLFLYPTPDVGGDGTNEIDIEFARWGSASANNADYVVYPECGPRLNNKNHKDNVEFQVVMNGDYSTHRFLWESDQVTFQSLYGHQDDDTNQFERWQYKPDLARLIPKQPLQVRMNLWLFKGRPPCNDAEVEIVISGFAYTPLDELD
jgi:beta-glucanase (GH16 family)